MSEDAQKKERARKALNYLVGQVIIKMGGKVDPAIVRKALVKRLNELADDNIVNEVIAGLKGTEV